MKITHSIFRSWLTIALLCLTGSLLAQGIQVTDFSFDEKDLTANIAGTEVIDPNNGRKCALIKVHTTQKGFTFDVGALGVTKTVPQGGDHPTEIWVYVPQGVKRLSIMHPQLGDLRDYNLGRTLQSAKTYHLTLQTGSVQTVVNPTLQKQWAVFTLVPATATLEVEGDLWEVDGQGVAQKKLPFGTYQYSVKAPRYQTSVGQFTVSKDKYAETVRLKPNFSVITFQAPADAEVWVDGERRGTGNCNVELTVGQYQVECRQESHLTTSRVVSVAQANSPQTITLEAPRPIYGLLDVTSSPSGARVTVDGEVVGETPLSLDNVLIGQRQVTVSLEGYTTPAVQTAIVSQDETATLDFQLKKNTLVPTTPNSTSGAATETITVNGVSFKMILVEGGTFTMGATSEQGSDADDDEKPVHRVTLFTYYIGETEVTQALWQAVMGSNPSKFKGAERPVENVSWEECQSFIRKLNSLTGRSFRLPAEAEWEYAARGGNKNQGYKFSGSNKLKNFAWCIDNSGSETHPVKTKSPNKLGIYDMSGNVWEWCQDWYGSYSSSSRTNPTGSTSGSYRVFRGGGWGSSAWNCRVSRRSSDAPSYWDDYLGMRLAL